MPRLPVRLVSAIELKQLFDDLELWWQIFDGTLTTLVVATTPATNPHYGGATSQMLIHRDQLGNHRCTTHRIITADGTILHWDESDVKLVNATVAKAHH